MTSLELALHNRLGLFGHFLGYKRADVEALSVEEFLGLCAWIDQANKPQND